MSAQGGAGRKSLGQVAYEKFSAEFPPEEGAIIAWDDLLRSYRDAWDAASDAVVFAFLDAEPKRGAPDHHALCAKDGCLGFEGGCPRVAFERGAEVERARANAEIDRLKKEAAAHWSLARTNGEDAGRLAAEVARIKTLNDEACAEIDRLHAVIEHREASI